MSYINYYLVIVILESMLAEVSLNLAYLRTNLIWIGF